MPAPAVLDAIDRARRRTNQLQVRDSRLRGERLDPSRCIERRSGGAILIRPAHDDVRNAREWWIRGMTPRIELLAHERVKVVRHSVTHRMIVRHACLDEHLAALGASTGAPR